MSKGFKDGHFQIGEGSISGIIACMLAILSFLGVLGISFPRISHHSRITPKL